MQMTKLLSFLGLSLLAAGMAVPASAGLIANPLSQTIDLGDSASVNIDISGLGNGASPALAAYTGLLVTYDSALLSPTGVIFSNRLGDPTDPTQTLLLSDLFLPSVVELDGISFLSSAELFGAQSTPSGQFTIATIAFQGIAAGTSPIDISYSALSDENGNPLTESITNGSVTVRSSTTVTPEPGTLGLLALGILGGVALRRKYGA